MKRKLEEEKILDAITQQLKSSTASTGSQ